MSYNLRSTNASPGDISAPVLATSQPESSARDANLRQNNNTPGNNEAERTANNPNPVVTISISDLQAIKKTIADLEEAAQQNFCCRRRSEFKADYKRVSKRSNLKSKTSVKYWRENHQKLDAFI